MGVEGLISYSKNLLIAGISRAYRYIASISREARIVMFYEGMLEACWKHAGSMLEPCWKHAVCCLRAGMPACQRLCVSACQRAGRFSRLAGFPGRENRPASKTNHISFPGRENMCKLIREPIRDPPRVTPLDAARVTPLVTSLDPPTLRVTPLDSRVLPQ